VGASEWAACYGHRRYIVPIGATAPHAAAMLETIKTDFETNDNLAGDFPEIAYPIRKLEGINNRSAGQVLSGTRTRIKWTEKRIILPTVMVLSGETGQPVLWSVLHGNPLRSVIQSVFERNSITIQAFFYIGQVLGQDFHHYYVSDVELKEIA
jgi:hypothetical protein